MAGQTTPFGRVVKWIVVPVIVGCVGYFFVGPSLGTSALKRIPALDKIIPKTEEPKAEEPVKNEGPEMDISSRPVDES